MEALITRILGNQMEMKDHFVKVIKAFAVLVNSVFLPFYKVCLLNMRMTEYLVLLSEAECHLLSETTETILKAVCSHGCSGLGCEI